MSNLTQIIGGQPYYNATAGNEKNNLLDFWKGTQVQYDYLKQINGTTSVAPAATVITFTVASTAYFTVGKRVYVTATSGNNLSRTPGTVTSITNATIDNSLNHYSIITTSTDDLTGVTITYTT